MLGAAVLILASLAAHCAAQVCTESSKDTCGLSYCDFEVVARPACQFRWPGTTDAIQFMCFTTNTTGSCRPCPPGWTASGAFCVECDPLQSCNQLGVPVCKGACAARRYPTCDLAVSGRVSCSSCAVNETTLTVGNRVLTRGGIIDSPDLCDAYFQCKTGFYLTTVQSTGSLTCLPCLVAERVQSGFEFLTRGLTFGDPFSCLYSAALPRRSAAGLGEYGNFTVQSCPLGTTSEPGLAVTEADCVACPSPPANGLFAPAVGSCTPACHSSYELRGDRCVLSDLSNAGCEEDGLSFVDGSCTPSPLPWTPPGSQPSGGLAVAITRRVDPVVSLDDRAEFSVSAATRKLRVGSVSDFCASTTSQIPQQGYVQDKPLFTVACRDVEFHQPYLVATGDKYLYLFLERSFGNTNRFIMWQVQKAPADKGNPAQVWQSFRLPSKVCSAVVQGHVVYMALCNSTFLSYALQPDLMMDETQSDVQPFVVEGTAYYVGRRLGRLIGTSEPGLADGMRDQARFKGPLSIAALPAAGRLFVADFANCRVAEVVVHQPGSFLTRATTLGRAACFTGPFPLPYPRGIASVLAGAAVLFLTDRGLVQIDAPLRRFTLVMSTSELSQTALLPTWVHVDGAGERLLLHNSTHTASVTRLQTQCPPRFKSKRGATCEFCSGATYTDGFRCLACSAVACPPGQALVPCSESADAYCRNCTSPPSYAFRYENDCRVVPLFPCPPGFFGFSDCSPCSSLPYTKLGSGLCQCLGLPLSSGNTACVVPSPLPDVPSWLPALRCTYKDENCTEYACYLANVSPRQCLPCPPGTHSSDGLSCAPCPGFRQPTPSRDSCVCRPPAVVSSDGAACTCPPGFAAGGPDGCSPCPPGTVKDYPTLLPDDFALLAGAQCRYCLPGQEPAGAGAVSCSPCGPGLYREGPMPACAACPGPRQYASNPASALSCAECRESCGQFQSWAPCPLNATLYACSACVAASRFRAFVPKGRGCQWSCAAGFYEYNGDCYPCTARSCPAGFRHTACTAYEDSHCRVPCEDPAKPLYHSVWGPACSWRCADGYAQRLKTFPGWSEYSCELPEDMPWSAGH
jgi:hypothetical protein